MFSKILILLLIFAGEGFAIYAEMLGAKSFSISNQPVLRIFLKMLLIFMVGGGFLTAGYIFGYKIFKNIWIVSAVSITSILIIEPILAILFFKQWPTTGAAIGLILGAIGFIFALVL